MQTEWWYESAIYDLDGDVVLARLILRDDGTAEILTDGSETLLFACRDDAFCWLTDEEYFPLDHLYETLAEENLDIDPRIKTLTDVADGDHIEQIIVPKFHKVSTLHMLSTRLAQPDETGYFIKQVTEE